MANEKAKAQPKSAPKTKQPQAKDPAPARVTREFLKALKDQVTGREGKWIHNLTEDLVQVGVDELEEMADALAEGRTHEAAMVFASRLSIKEFQAYQKRTTRRLAGVAGSRARLGSIMHRLAGATGRALGKSLKAGLAALK